MTTPALSASLLTSDTAVGTWTVDPARTQVRIKHSTFWGLMKVTGVFTDVGGSGEVAADHRVTGSITVATASVDTGNAKRDDHLRSDHFFDAATHPTFVVAIHSVTAAGEQLELAGELTARGVREPITLTGEVTGLDAGTLAVHVTGTVDRHRFGISGNQLGMIRGLTGLDIDAVFTRATA